MAIRFLATPIKESEPVLGARQYNLRITDLDRNKECALGSRVYSSNRLNVTKNCETGERDELDKKVSALD